MRTHYLVSPEPVNFAGQATALCGATLAHPEPVVMVEMESRGLPEFQSLRDCAKCFRSAELGTQLGKPGKVYLYGIVEGEEALHSGDTLEKLEKLVEAKSVNAR